MGLLRLTVPGSWSIYSKTDPRWRVSGRSEVGGLVCPQECKDKIKELEDLYGDPPVDLEWGYMKD